MELTEIAGYRVIRRLGAGGMGQVFLVQHPRLPRLDALKLLDAGVSRNDDFASRFQREADLLAQLSHPNIVILYDRGELDERLWITMEFVEGTDADELVKARGPLPIDLVLALIGGAAAGLDFAWRKQRITHRDVKPANILVAFDGDRPEAVKLADFGIAKAADEATSLTATGLTVGTVAYLSPEAIEGRDVDNRSDLYSLGCTAFHLLTGQPPFPRATMAALLSAHLNQPVPPITDIAPHLPRELNSVFTTVLAKNPDDRYQAGDEFVAALSAASGGKAAIPARTPTESALAAHSPSGAAYAPTMIGQTRMTADPPADVPASRPRGTSVVFWTALSVIVLAGIAAALLLPRNDEPVRSAATELSTTASDTRVSTSTQDRHPAPTIPDPVTTTSTTFQRPSTARVSYTVEADTPSVQIAYSPGQWQTYTLAYSNLAGRYSLSIQTTPERAENMYIAIRGSTSQHCRIRVAATVVVTDSGTAQAVCQA